MASPRRFQNPPYPVTPPAEPDPSQSPFSPKEEEVVSPLEPKRRTLPPPLPPKLPQGNTSRTSSTTTPTSPHYYNSHYAQQEALAAGRTSVGSPGSPPPPPRNPARPTYTPPHPPEKNRSPPVPPKADGAADVRLSFEEQVRRSQDSARRAANAAAAGSRPTTGGNGVAAAPTELPPSSRTDEEAEARRRKRREVKANREKENSKLGDMDRKRRGVNSRRTRLRLLALDGGGIRGYSTLLLLENLMLDTFVELHGRPPKRGEEVTKPCEVFDLICGTGTGGLIAIMLGRLRMSISTCKEVYVRMTRYVFETDKRVIGIPYGETLFKASKLERAIKEVVRERSKDDAVEIPEEFCSDEEDWDLEPSGGVYEDDEKGLEAKMDRVHTRTESIRGIADASRLPSMDGGSGVRRGIGNMDALMHDKRKGRCKTFVTAVYKGSNKTSTPAYLRSYSSGVESMSYPDCKIWQAGRATSATLAAFKEIKISQDVFLDEGGGKYNPTPQILEEALVNEWPGRDVGVVISLGTGKRPASAGAGDSKVQWWENLSSSLDVFTQARRRLMAKIDDCENIHQHLLKEQLASYGVSNSRYFRFNVDTGVGEVAMNEWSRLSEVSTATRVYLANHDVNSGMKVAARKLGKITQDKQKRRVEKDMEKLGFHDSSAASSRPNSSSKNEPVYEMAADSVVVGPDVPEGMMELPATEAKKPLVVPPPLVPGIRITPPTVKYPPGTRPRRNVSNGGEGAQVELPG